jgi:uncharacterized protein
MAAHGDDLRRPYAIALGAGHLTLARLLDDAAGQAGFDRSTTAGPERTYSRAFPLQELSRFHRWNAMESQGLGVGFLHEDFTVTRSIWHDGERLWDDVTDDWIRFCTHELGFRVPDDFELAGTNDT